MKILQLVEMFMATYCKCYCSPSQAKKKTKQKSKFIAVVRTKKEKL